MQRNKILIVCILVFMVLCFCVVSILSCIGLSRLRSKETKVEKPSKLVYGWRRPIGAKLLKYEGPTPRHVCINLARRRDDFKRTYRSFEQQGINLERFEAVDGSILTPRSYVGFFDESQIKRLEENPKYMGHLGCALSHNMVMSSIKEDEVVVICEDDVIIPSDYKVQLMDRLERLRIHREKTIVNWDILYLGMTCEYKHTDKCHRNDNSPVVESNLARVRHSVGLWCYAINGKRAVNRILSNTLPFKAFIDHAISEQGLANGSVVGFVSIPTIGSHPGTFSIDSFNWTDSQSVANYRSDTNVNALVKN